jgi:putative redox protein
MEGGKNPMQSERIQFDNGRGQVLVGRLDQPESGTDVMALFAHCFTCTKNLKAIAHISRALADEGIAVFRFDFTGLGESEGDFSDTNFTSNAEDLIAASTFLEENYSGPRILIGHSLGGAAILQAAHSIPSARAVATIAAPCEPSHLNKLLDLEGTELEKAGEVEVHIGGRPFRIRRQFIIDLNQANMKEKIQSLGKALIIFHSPHDRIVGIDNAAYIFQAAQHPKSFISLDRADHLLMDETDSRYVGSIIAAWARRYI